MSIQQVNLYRDELKKQKLNYSAPMLLQLSIFLIVILSSISAYSAFQLQQQQTKLVAMQQKQKNVMASLQRLQTEFTKRKKDSSLSAKVMVKTKELENKKKVIAILGNDDFGNTQGFIKHITGLARQRIEGLWLTQIRIAGGGTDVTLHGTTSTSALLPKYLQRLSAEKVFNGTEFQSLLMQRQEKKKQWLNFSLQNKKVNGVR